MFTSGSSQGTGTAVILDKEDIFYHFVLLGCDDVSLEIVVHVGRKTNY